MERIVQTRIQVCPSCGGRLQFDEHLFACGSCSTVFPKTDHGVWDFRTNQLDGSEPRIYAEPQFQRWLKIFRETESKNWVIYRNRLFRFFAQSGHRILGKRIEQRRTPDELILEIGAGTGSLLKFCSAENFVAVDTSMESLEFLKAKWPQAQCVCVSSKRLPFANNSFDQVVSLHTFEHLYFLAESLDEISRVQKPEGIMHYVIPTEGGLAFWLGRKFVTGPHLRRTYDLSVDYVMEREHINDAKRVLKFLGMYFTKVERRFWPLPSLPFLSVNSMIFGECHRPRLKDGVED